MQTVNLYNGMLLPKPEELPIQNLLLSTMAGILIAAIFWFVNWNGIEQVRTQHQVLFEQKEKLKEQVEQLQEIIPSVEEKIRAENKISKMQRQLQFQQQTARLITQLNQKQTAGYFGVLSNLAELNKKSYWFTRIMLNSDQLNLEGKTFESAAVANMVTQLQQLPNTKNVNFSKVIIEREKSRDRAASFFLYAKDRELNNGSK